jgi:hypothetical protein
VKTRRHVFPAFRSSIGSPRSDFARKDVQISRIIDRSVIGLSAVEPGLRVNSRRLPEVSSMKQSQRIVGYTACTLAVSFLLAACNDYVPPRTDVQPPAPAEIEGIATPSSVAVVTATNAD